MFTLRARPARYLVVALAAGLLSVTPMVARPAPAFAAPKPACAPQRPDAASAAVTAKACHARVEIAAGRSENTQVFANPDGTSTFESSVVPARVHRADGSWVPVDTTLRVRPDGWLAPVASTIDVAFSSGGPGPFV